MGDLTEECARAQELTRQIADDVGAPLFYRERREPWERSCRLFASCAVVQAVLETGAGRGNPLGHGRSHGEKVAVDAGSLILIEAKGAFAPEDRERLVLCSHLAGLLHDIRREEPDHARAGARAAGVILDGVPLDGKARLWICDAIANHEAFRPPRILAAPEGQLLSDALYDADKFRWGPDNFTETLWAMASFRETPLAAVLPRFLQGLDGIARIRATFRTDEGKRYGPDFIDRGLEIGRRLYEALAAA